MINVGDDERGKKTIKFISDRSMMLRKSVESGVDEWIVDCVPLLFEMENVDPGSEGRNELREEAEVHSSFFKGFNEESEEIQKSQWGSSVLEGFDEECQDDKFRSPCLGGTNEGRKSETEDEASFDEDVEDHLVANNEGRKNETEDEGSFDEDVEDVSCSQEEEIEETETNEGDSDEILCFLLYMLSNPLLPNPVSSDRVMEVIDLTVDEGDENKHGLIANDVHSGVETEEVWGENASVADAIEIENMLREGSGVFGHPNCKLELGESLLEGAGRGVFLKKGCVIRHGQCITQYSGRKLHSAKRLSEEEQLRSIEVKNVQGKPFIVVGETRLKNGDGFGSFLNSSVCGRTLSFCRFVYYNRCVYAMAYCSKEQYPLRGYIELYLTAGKAWWSLFNDRESEV